MNCKIVTVWLPTTSPPVSSLFILLQPHVWDWDPNTTQLVTWREIGAENQGRTGVRNLMVLKFQFKTNTEVLPRTTPWTWGKVFFLRGGDGGGIKQEGFGEMRSFWWKLRGQKPQLSFSIWTGNRVSESAIRLLQPHCLHILVFPWLYTSSPPLEYKLLSGEGLWHIHLCSSLSLKQSSAQRWQRKRLMNVLSIGSSCQPTDGSSIPILSKELSCPHSHSRAPCDSWLLPWLQSWTHAQPRPSKTSPSPDHSDCFKNGQVTVPELKRQMRQRGRDKGKCFSARIASSKDTASWKLLKAWN